jgi:prolyl oligopeptidase
VVAKEDANDPRVATFHAAKFVARLQEASTSKAPVLLRMESDAGHGMGSTRQQRDELLADIYGFSLWCSAAKGVSG